MALNCYCFQNLAHGFANTVVLLLIATAGHHHNTHEGILDSTALKAIHDHVNFN